MCTRVIASYDQLGPALDSIVSSGYTAVSPDTAKIGSKLSLSQWDKRVKNRYEYFYRTVGLVLVH